MAEPGADTHPSGSGPRVRARGGALRVGMVTTSFPREPGDFAGHFVARLAEALAARGHSVEVLAPHARGLVEHDEWATPDGGAPITVTRFRYASDAAELVAYGDGIPTNVRRDPRALSTLPAFVRVLKRATAAVAARNDVVHVQWAPTAALARSRSLGAPMVVTLHGSDVALAERGGVWRRLLERGLRPPTAAAIAVSDDLAARLRASVPDIELPPLTVIPTGIEASLLDRELPRSSPEARVSIAYVGRLLETKGVLDLADAMASLPSDVLLVVAGDGPAREAMVRRLADARVGHDRVTWLGAVPRDEALAVMAAADLVAVPSHAEGAGLVALEASALGTCVVATRTGVMRDVLADDQLVEPGDVASLTALLVRFATDPMLRADRSEAARRRVAAGFTWDVLAERVEAVYRTVIAAGAAR